MLLELKHITFGHSDGRLILKDISLGLETGRVYALMGSNGAGKTTLVNIISGFIKQNRGDVFFKSKKITNIKAYKRNLVGVGRTFQDLRLITKLSVEENIVLSMKDNPTDNVLDALLPEIFHRRTLLQLKQRTNKLINQYFLSEVRETKVSEISYGQQKLLSLACCVANDAALFLLDEPVAGIQPEYRSKIALLIRQLKHQGKTILLIEHNTDFIANVADEIFFLQNGEISIFDKIETLRKNQIIMNAYT